MINLLADYQYNVFLHEIMDIFVSILYDYVPEGSPLRDYFVGVISVVITASFICGSFMLLCCVTCETFKTIRGSRS